MNTLTHEKLDEFLSNAENATEKRAKELFKNRKSGEGIQGIVDQLIVRFDAGLVNLLQENNYADELEPEMNEIAVQRRNNIMDKIAKQYGN